LIYCGLYGFSEAGPYAGRPAFDDIIQAMSGMADLQGRGKKEDPSYVSSIIADKITGLAGVNAILAALYERSNSGLGQAIEVPMFETLVGFNLMEHMGGATFSHNGQQTLAQRRPEMGYARALSPARKPYKTQDGHIGLLPYTTEQWQRFFQMAGQPQVMQDPRFAQPAARAQHIAQLYEILQDIVPTKTTDQWLSLLEAADIPASRVNRLEDLIDDPHLKATGFFKTENHPTEGPITYPSIAAAFDRTPATVRSLAPNLGEHTEAVRAALEQAAQTQSD
jgi:crotonobetainyl-CoA:carnitine CoA-transferase CaiB-like acyl-CoA transferase